MLEKHKALFVSSIASKKCSVPNLIAGSFSLLSVIWVVGLLISGLGVPYMLGFRLTNDFPFGYTKAIAISSCLLTLVLGFWCYPWRCRLSKESLALCLLGLMLSGALFYKLFQGILEHPAAEDNVNWLMLSCLISFVWAVLAWRVFSNGLFVCCALTLVLLSVGQSTLGQDEIIERITGFWLVKSGAWSTWSKLYFAVSTPCLFAFRADQTATGYRYLKRACVWIARVSSLPHSILRFLTGKHLFWTKLSLVIVPLLMVVVPFGLSGGIAPVLCISLFAVGSPIIVARIFGEKTKGFGKKRTRTLVLSSLMVLSYFAAAVAMPSLVIGALFAAALSVGAENEAHNRKATDFVRKGVSIAYCGMLLILIASLIGLALILISICAEYIDFGRMPTSWAFVSCIVLPMLFLGAFALLRGSFVGASNDALVAGLTAFVFFAAIQGSSPGLSGAFAVLAMLSGTMFGAIASAVIDARKSLLIALCAAASEIYGWAVGSASVLVALSMIAVMVAAFGSIAY